MDAAYRNKKDIRERVAAVVSTYTPEKIQDPMQGTQKDSSTSVVKMKIHPYEKAEKAKNKEKEEKAVKTGNTEKTEKTEKTESTENEDKAEKTGKAKVNQRKR